jgi:hypothetical protein
MDVQCPTCGEPLELLSVDEIRKRHRYHCVPCCLWYERDASGLVSEVD